MPVVLINISVTNSYICLITLASYFHKINIAIINENIINSLYVLQK